LQAGGIGVALSGSNPTPNYAGDLIVNHIEDYAFTRYEMGFASAVSVVLLDLYLPFDQARLPFLRGNGKKKDEKHVAYRERWDALYRRSRERTNMGGRYQSNKINPQSFGWSQIKFYVILVPLALILLLPIIFIFTTAFKPADELFVFPPRLWVLNPTWDNFSRLFKAMSTSAVPASRYIFNSIVVALLTVTSFGRPFRRGRLHPFQEGFPRQTVPL
jgi:hypothetical protein